MPRTIVIPAIDPDDNQVRENEVLVSRIVGWYQRDEDGWKSPGPVTRISLDSGAEYTIAESLGNFRNRLLKILDATNQITPQ